jgi:hypothetical protein
MNQDISFFSHRISKLLGPSRSERDRRQETGLGHTALFLNQEITVMIHDYWPAAEESIKPSGHPSLRSQARVVTAISEVQIQIPFPILLCLKVLPSLSFPPLITVATAAGIGGSCPLAANLSLRHGASLVRSSVHLQVEDTSLIAILILISQVPEVCSISFLPSTNTLLVSYHHHFWRPSGNTSDW